MLPRSLHLTLVDFGNSMRSAQTALYKPGCGAVVQTLYYRAPEVLFGLPFGSAIDMWSFGCLIAELRIGRPLFFGPTPAVVLGQMLKIRGPMPRHVYCNAPLAPRDGSETVLFGTGEWPQAVRVARLMQLMGTTDAEFASFVDACLDYDPAVRCSAVDAMRHPFVDSLFPCSLLLDAAPHADAPIPQHVGKRQQVSSAIEDAQEPLRKQMRMTRGDFV